MTATAFDTLTAARDLEAAGMARQQAEAVAGAIRAGQGELSTKADLAAVRSDLGALRQATQSDIAGLRWIVGINLAISLATLATVLAMAFRP